MNQSAGQSIKDTTWQELAGQIEQLTRRPDTEAAGSPDSLCTSGDKESRVCGAGTPHPSPPPGPNRQQQGPGNVERHTGEAQLHIRQDVLTRPSTSQDSRYAFPGVSAVFTAECGGGMSGYLIGNEGQFFSRNDQI
eukprot:superscaffoldBa00002358_g14015